MTTKLASRSAAVSRNNLNIRSKIAIKIDGMKHKSVLFATALLALLFAQSANAQGLAKGVTILNSLKGDVYNIVSALAVIILIVLAVCYAAKWCTMETFARWGIGCIIAGCASQIASMFFS
jgi:type IV secretory pathway VirB2 component (pilin)